MQTIIEKFIHLAENERRKHCESKSFVVPVDYLGQDLHALVLEATGRKTFPEKSQLSVFFDESALSLIKKVSVNYYWFWRLASGAAQKSARLPIRESDLVEAIRDLRSHMAEHVNFADLLAKQDDVVLALAVAYGVIVIKRGVDPQYSLELNPICELEIPTAEQSEPAVQVSVQDLGPCSMYE